MYYILNLIPYYTPDATNGTARTDCRETARVVPWGSMGRQSVLAVPCVVFGYR